MQARKPIVADQFYPGRREICVEQINDCIEQMPPPSHLPEKIVAGIVPHAGWMFSGLLAVMVFNSIRHRHPEVDTFIILGAAHGYFGQMPAVYDKGAWQTPLGEIAVDEDLAEQVLATKTAVSDLTAHRSEHSIEVQIPFAQHLFPGAGVLPIIVPANSRSIELGRAVGEIISRHADKKIICIGSTDLTHYGPRYGFTPMGAGAAGLKWAHEVNDRRFIDRALKVDVEGLLADAVENLNACGPGAAAAAVAAAKNLGAKKGVLLAHTNSNQVMQQKYGSTGIDSVGYAAMVF